MSNGLTHQEQQVLIFVLRENKASLEAELNLLKSETAHSMVMCKCTKSYKLPSEPVCTICTIRTLEESLARSGALLADTEAKLDGAMTEANDLRVRVEGLLRVVEELSNG